MIKRINFNLLKTIVIPLITIVIAFSCSKEKSIRGFVLETNVDFNVLNETGEDLLNPATPGYFPFEDMKLFYLINNERVEVFDPYMDLPSNIMLITETSPFRLRCFTYDGEEGFTHEENGVKIGTAIAFLEFNEYDTDTIITEWASKENYFVNKKVWYNGELQAVNSVFQVVKTN